MCLRLLRIELIFIGGFAIGFISFILFDKINNDRHEFSQCKRHESFALWNTAKKWKQLAPKNYQIDSNVSYATWFKKQNVEIQRLDMDASQYGPKVIENRRVNLLESEWLKMKIHLSCVVFIKKIRLAQSIKNTWGSRCNRIYFFSNDLEDTSVPIIKLLINATSSWQILCEAMAYIWKASLPSESLQWIIFINDDTMVLPENLRYLVAPLNYNDGYYLGHAVTLWGQSYNIALAGYVLSRGAFVKIVEQFDTHEKCAAGGKYWKKEDYYLAKHLAEYGIYPADTRDDHLRGTFHGYSLQTLLWGVARPGSYFTKALYPPGDECCSPKSVTFSIPEPDKLYTINYLLYHLYIYKGAANYGNKPAPTVVPEKDIWKIALKEEFNLTDVDEISADRFYEIWRTRYSEPSQFINRNYQNITGVLQSILTAYEIDRRVINKP